MVGTLCYCGGLLKAGQCDRCGRSKAKTQHKQTTAQRGYDHHWRQLSERYRTENPLCEDCTRAGKVRAADEVHHKVKVSKAPERRLDWSNLMALCTECHAKRTKRGE